MYLRFLTQTLNDFKSFSGKHTLAWDTPGVTFVCGRNEQEKRLSGNGCGKSTIWDALCWCLFGQTPGGLRNTDVVPWRGGKPDVSQELEIDGRKRKVRRTANPNRLYLDGEDVSQERLEEVLGLNLELFTNTVLLAQGGRLFFDRTPKDKMALFSDTLQLERWDDRAKAAGEASARGEAEVLRLGREQEAASSALAELGTSLSAAKEAAAAWVTAQRVREREAIAKLAVVRKELNAKDAALANALLKADGAGVRTAELGREIDALLRELRPFQDQAVRSEVAAQAATERLEGLRAELGQLSKAKVCPSCGQPIKAKDTAGRKLHLLEEIETQKGKLEAETTVQREAKASALRVGKALDAAKAKRAALVSSEGAAQAAALQLKGEVATLQARMDELDRVARTEEKNPHTAQIALLQARMKELRTKEKALVQALEVAARKAESARFWMKGFKDIKLQLIEDVLDELELATNSMLEEVGLVGWEVHYDIERETKSGTAQRALTVQILSPASKDWVKWESWSGGEQQRLRLVGALALADVFLNHAGVQANVEILDEPAVYWSSEGVQELCAFLADRARQTDRSIFYTEHNAVESVHFSDVLTVVRDKDGSYVAGD